VRPQENNSPPRAIARIAPHGSRQASFVGLVSDLRWTLPSMVSYQTTLLGQRITSIGNHRCEACNYLAGKGWGAVREELCGPRRVLGHVA
jgi:hypothetical protein